MGGAASSAVNVQPAQQSTGAARMQVSYPLPTSTLPLNPDGTRVYHLALAGHDLARSIILVGDPERVKALGEHFLSSVEADADHRGLRSITGLTKATGTRISFVTSGMGVGSTEIVMGELAALNEMDVSTRMPLSAGAPRPPLRIIRVGTCGALHEDVPLGTAVVSAYSIGLDSLGLYYDSPAPDATCVALENDAQAALEGARRPGSRFGTRARPYAARARPRVVRAIREAAAARNFDRVRVGITACAPGFFAPQGRVLLPQLAPTFGEVDHVMSAVGAPTPEEFRGPGVPDRLRVENMEMESSAVLHLAGALGYEAAAVCLTVAHRRKNTFLESGQGDLVLGMSEVAVKALEDMEAQDKAAHQ